MIENIGLLLVWLGARSYLLGGIAIAIFGWFHIRKNNHSVGSYLGVAAFLTGSLAIHFFVFKPIFIDQPNQQRYLVQHGIETEGCVRSLQDTAMHVNRAPVLKITIEYRFDGKDYKTELKQAIPYAVLPELRVGRCFLLLVDPQDPARVAFG